MREKHDQLFRKALENPVVAQEFFQAHLPEAIKNLLDFSSLQLENTTFIEPNLRDSISDIVFSAQLDKQEGYLFLLLEHQSKPDRFMAFRLFKYMINILDRYLIAHPKAKRLPFVYPLVFFHGSKKYAVSRSLWTLVDHSELARNTWMNDYQLINVHDIPDSELKTRIWSGILEFFLKHSHERTLLKRWQEIKAILPELTKISLGYDYLELILCYTLTKIEHEDKLELERMLKSTLNQEIGTKLMTSLAQYWKEQGKEQGFLEGMQIGETKGIQIGETNSRIEIAKKMLAQGADLTFISLVTGLNPDRIRSFMESS